MKVYRSKEKRILKNGVEYNPIIIRTKDGKEYIQNGKGCMYEMASTAVAGAAIAYGLTVGAIIALG
jgi:hypothetical protein